MLKQPALRPLFLDDVAEIPGIGEQLVRVLGLGGGPRPAAPSEHPIDGIQQIERPERLSHQGVCAGGAGVCFARLPAGEHDGARRAEAPVLFELPAERETARSWAADVEHDERWAPY